MSRYIDADALGKSIIEKYSGRSNGKAIATMALDIINNAQTADVVEVVRCRDCINWEFRDGWDHCRFFDWLLVDDNGYCHFGERREHAT